MPSWSDKLQEATQTLVTAVTALHNKSQEPLMLRLLTSVTDILHLVHQLNADHRCLETQLQREQKASHDLIARIEALERRYAHVQTALVMLPGQHRGQHHEQHSDEASARSAPESNTQEKNCQAVRQPSSGSNQLAPSRTPPRAPPRTPPRTPPRPSSPPQQASISPYQPPSPKQLPPLPTIEDLEAERRDRRSQKRALAAQKPPPCEKCCIRKRADMLREHGYVKEDVFLRWSKRPGGCIAFMHYDEPLPEGAGSELSFKDTETESPSP